ncbi:efflux RND transporter periplasmic adaptor subunit [Bradyrhizobium sp. AZCC 1708]|uniref:efflux RND transporter periplasmic adaptor subunit n=1 Tax=Bradyrhizobium sp. AZCC 1708 TaxID=3117015 RepID=UPI002FF40EDB
MFRRMAIMLVAVGVVFAAIFGFQAFKAAMIQKAIATLRNPPQTVSTIAAETQPWRDRLQAVGSARAEKGADLSPQVSGLVKAIHFRSGEKVEKGALLVELEATEEIARLHAIQATAELSQLNYDRNKQLLTTNAVSQQTLDTALATLKNNQAQVAQQQAVVDYKSIRAPFSGRLGIRRIDLGQYIAPGTTIVTLQQLDPIYIDFYLPQQALASIRVGQTVVAEVDTYPGHKFTGRILAISPRINEASRNVQVRATFDNPDDKLRPGMFASIEIEVGTPNQYVTLPKTAIYHNAYGDIAYLVETSKGGEGAQDHKIARQVFVKTGPTRGDQVAVLEAFSPGMSWSRPDK